MVTGGGTRKRTRPLNDHDDDTTPTHSSHTSTGNSKRNRLMHDHDEKTDALVDPFRTADNDATPATTTNHDDDNSNNNSDLHLDANRSDDNNDDIIYNNVTNKGAAADRKLDAPEQACILHLDSLFTARPSAFRALKT